MTKKKKKKATKKKAKKKAKSRKRRAKKMEPVEYSQDYCLGHQGCTCDSCSYNGAAGHYSGGGFACHCTCR